MGCKLFFQSILLFFTCFSSAQVNIDLNLDDLHQEWHFSNSESGNDQIAFYSNFRRAEEIDGSITSYKFSQRDNILYLSHTKSRNFSRCGNGLNTNIKASFGSWNKGIWELFEEEGIYYLEFKHYSAGKANKYNLIRKETFEILQINQDKMMLLKLY